MVAAAGQFEAAVADRLRPALHRLAGVHAGDLVDLDDAGAGERLAVGAGLFGALLQQPLHLVVGEVRASVEQ
jgi:hypothetical protein